MDLADRYWTIREQQLRKAGIDDIKTINDSIAKEA